MHFNLPAFACPTIANNHPLSRSPINEVFEVADRFMILKTGELVGVVKKNKAKIDDIVTMIISGKLIQ